MPISDEVIELAPVKKTKKTLIILLIAIGVSVALAVTFLVMYLLKPNLPADTSVVNGVTITQSTLFSSKDESGSEVLKASIGNEYTVSAKVSAENGTNEDIKWQFSPSDALVNTKISEDTLTFTFTPNTGFNGQEVTVTALSAAKNEVVTELKFTVVDQGTAVFIPSKYYPEGTDSKNGIAVVDGKVSIPYYTVTNNNKSYTLLFEQKGEFNELTGEYAELTNKESPVSALSSDESVLKVERTSYSSVIFKAQKEGNATLTLTAQSGHSFTFNVNVQSGEKLGYVENIYFFDKAVVDAAFIARYYVGGKLDINKLNADYGGKTPARSDAVMNPDMWELPFSNEKYEDIFSHVLVNPISIQYDGKDIKTDWHKNIRVTSSSDAIKVDSQTKPGYAGLITSGLAGGQLTFEDGTAGSIRTNIKVNYRVIAGNLGGNPSSPPGVVTAQAFNAEDKLSGNIATAGSTENDTLSVEPQQRGRYTVTYNLLMPGNTVTANIVDGKLMNLKYKLEYDESIFTVYTVRNASTALKPNKEYDITKEDVKFNKPTGADSSSAVQVTAVMEFDFVVNANASDTTQAENKPQIIFTKAGTQLAATEDWDNKNNKRDVRWSKGIKMSIAAQAKNARFISSDDAVAAVTDKHTKPGNIEFDKTDDHKATIYVQYTNNGDRLPFNFYDLVTAEGKYSAELTVGDKSNIFEKVTVQAGDGDVEVTGNTLAFSDYNPNLAQTVTRVSVKLLSVKGNNIGVFHFDVYVIDGVRSFVNMSDGEAYYSYDGSTQQLVGADISVPLTVNSSANRFTSSNPVQYTFGSVELYYGSIVNPDNRLTPEKSGNSTYYVYHANDRDKTSTRLFYYNGSSLVPQVDLYEFSYNNKVDLTTITVEYKMASSDYYIGQFKKEPAPAPTAIKQCRFIRKADDIYVSRDRNFDTANRLATDKAIPANQNVEVTLYVSSVISINGGADKIITEVENKTYLYDKASIGIPVSTGGVEAITVKTGEHAKDAHHYYWFSFNVPTVKDVTNGDTYNFTLSGEGGHSPQKRFIIVAQNKARGINKIGIYTDEACSTELGDDKVFGKFGVRDLTSLPLYIKVTYNAIDETVATVFDHFEAVKFTLPEFLTVTSQNVTAVNGEYSFAADDNDVNKKDFTSAVLPITVSLKDGYETQYTAARQENIRLWQEQTGGSSYLEVEKTVKLDAALQTLSVSGGDGAGASVNAGGKGSIDYTFNVNSASDLNASVTFNLAYNTYTAIVYDYKTKLEFTDPTAITGLSLNTQNIKGETSSVTIGLNGITAPIAPTKFTLVFTDNTDAVGTTFTVEFNIAVNVSVYAVSFDKTDSLTVTTDGKTDESEASATTHVTINNGITPNDNALDVSVQNADKTTASGLRATYDKASQNITVYAKNEIISGTYTLVVGKDGKELVQKTIVISTTAAYIKLAENNDITVTDSADGKTASITVDKDHSSFKLAAVIENKQTDTNSIVYSLASSKDSGKITVSDEGVITFANDITAQRGTIDYTISYTDKASGKPYTIKVSISYTVAIDTVTLINTDSLSSVYRDNTFTLYYENGGAYTSLDLASYIKASNSHFTQVAFDTAKFVTTTSNVLTVSGDTNITNIVPRGTTTDVQGDLIAISVGGVSCATQYRVIVKSIAALTLTPSLGEIDKAVSDAYVTVGNNLSDASYAGLTCKYTLIAPNKSFTVTDNNKITIGSPRPNNNSDTDKGYEFTATAVFAANTVTGFALNGTLEKTATYTLKVNTKSISADFTLKCGSNAVEANKGHYLGVNEIHTVNINSVKGDVTYSLKISNNVVTKTEDFSNGVAKISVNGNNSGEFTLIVTATYYGEAVSTVKKTYSFVHVSGIDATLAYDGTTVEETQNTQKIDDLNKKFTYTVTGAPTDSTYELHAYGEGVSTSVSGNVLTITVSKTTTLVVYGTVTVGTDANKYYVYLPRREITLTATEPNFTANLDHSSINPAATATLSVAASSSDFNGDYKVTYSVKSGSQYIAEFNSAEKTVKLKAENDIVTGGPVTVGVSVEVTSGALIGKVYDLDDVTVNVTGVARPTVGWNGAMLTSIAAGDSIDILYALGDGFNADDVTFDIIGTGVGLTKGEDFDISDNTLTVNSTDRTKAGGEIKLVVKLTVTGAIHNGYTTSTTEHTVVINNPQLQNVTVALDGSYKFNMQNHVKPYVYDVGGHFVERGDTFNVTGVTSNTSGVTTNGTEVTVSAGTNSASFTVNYKMTSGVYNNSTLSSTITVTFVQPITVKFDLNYGSGASEDRKYQKGSNYGTNWVIPERTGYTFVGWFTAATNGTQINASDIVPDSGATVYAHWAAKTYTVSFDANGGEGSATSVPVTYASAYSGLPTTGFTRTGYTFIGWGLTPVATTVVQTVETAGDHTLYAIWQAETYTIIYNFNEGNSINYGEKTVTFGGTYENALNVTNPTKDPAGWYQYDFAGWFTQASGGDKFTNKTIVDKTFVVNNVITFYAQWSASGYSRNYTVEYTLNGGTMFGSADKYSDKFTAKQDKYTYTNHNNYVPKRTGYTFVGWFEDQTLNNQVGNSFVMEKNDTKKLYAKWQEIPTTFTVTLNPNGGVLNGSNDAYAQTLNVGQSFNLHNSLVPTYSGRKFLGWFEAQTGGQKYTAEITGTKTLYAQWEVIPTTFTVTLDLCGGNVDGSTENITDNSVAANSSYSGHLSTNPQKGGHTFIGWFTKETGGNKINEVITVTENVTLYAHWQEIPATFTVTLIANRGEPEDVTIYSQTFNSGESVSLHKYIIPEYKDHRFLGWFTEKEGGTESPALITETVTLYAHWIEQVTVKYVVIKDGTRNEHATVTCDKGTTIDIEAKIPDDDNYTYTDWTVESGSPISGSKITVNEDTVLIATRSANTPPVTPDETTGSETEIGSGEGGEQTDPEA